MIASFIIASALLIIALGIAANVIDKHMGGIEIECRTLEKEDWPK